MKFPLVVHIYLFYHLIYYFQFLIIILFLCTPRHPRFSLPGDCDFFSLLCNTAYQYLYIKKKFYLDLFVLLNYLEKSILNKHLHLDTFMNLRMPVQINAEGDFVDWKKWIIYRLPFSASCVHVTEIRSYEKQWRGVVKKANNIIILLIND